MDFDQPFKFFAIRLNGYGNRLNARISRLVSVYKRFSWPFNEKALVSVLPKKVTYNNLRWYMLQKVYSGLYKCI